MADAVERPEDLYGVELGEFVAERNALAARLKASGDAEAAAVVKALCKPPKSAWALDAVAREQPALVQQVLDSANAVVAAINDGGDPLRAAQSAYTAAVAAVVDAAAERAGLAGDATERVRATVLAAGAEPNGEVATALRAGTLADDVAAPGFSFTGVVPGATPRPRAGTPVRTTSADEPHDTAVDAATADAAAAQAAARAEQRRRARERQRLAAQVERLEQRVGRLCDVADSAEAAAREARSQVSRAQAELLQAQRQLQELEADD